MEKKHLAVVCLVLLLLSVSPMYSPCGELPEIRPVPLPRQQILPVIPEKIVYGRSFEGRELEAYRFGQGENVMVLTFAMHGYEDSFDRDGQLLVDTARRLMDTLSVCGSVLVEPEGWSVYVLPCLNPDGLQEGRTCDGPGRCTLGQGVDLNRAFPYRFSPGGDARNQAGSQPLSVPEAESLASFIRSVQGSGANVLIDVHGWYCQTLVTGDRNNHLFRGFSLFFPDNYYTSLEKGGGYLTAWAAYELGCDACLFEFPNISDEADFYRQSCDIRFIQAVAYLLRSYLP